MANFSGASITIYAAGATGDANPVATIAGPSTGLTGPGGIALDGAGKLYVANGNMILVYAAGATGDAAPIGTIAGPSTGLGGVVSVALDAAGRLYAISHFGPDSSSITVYAAGATGDASPIATITGPGTGLNVPEHIALDGAGRIYVTNWGTTSVTVYASGTTGDASPIATITGPNTGLSSVGGLAVGP